MPLISMRVVISTAFLILLRRYFVTKAGSLFLLRLGEKVFYPDLQNKYSTEESPGKDIGVKKISRKGRRRA